MTFLDYARDINSFFQQKDSSIDFNGHPPKVIFDKTEVSPLDPFIPTGHYDWLSDTITLNVAGRQLKDILRTYCHELIHAWQHRRDGIEFERLDKSGRLEDNDLLRKCEEEAYLKGNILFREWTEAKTNKIFKK